MGNLPSTTSIHFLRTRGMPFQLEEEPSEATEQGESKIGTTAAFVSDLMPSRLADGGRAVGGPSAISVRCGHKRGLKIDPLTW